MSQINVVVCCAIFFYSDTLLSNTRKLKLAPCNRNVHVVVRECVILGEDNHVLFFSNMLGGNVHWKVCELLI